MPGFKVDGEGNNLGDAPTNVTETKRKHRWYFSTLEPVADILLYLQSASRPNFTFEEPEMHHNEEVVRFAGKRSWEAITMTWYDAVQPKDVSSKLYDWVNGIVGSIPNADVNPPDEYKKEGNLEMLDGAGGSVEKWVLKGCWPQTINWGDLDYTSTDIQTCECTMRFDRAQRES